MDETGILKLVNEIDEVDFRKFWWGSSLLDKCSQIKDSRIVNALLVRHQHLGNKEADSAHLLRNTIKEIEGPDLRTLWVHIDNAANQREPGSDYGQPYFWQKAAGLVLGKIGGAPALKNTNDRLIPSYSSQYAVLGKLAVHLLTRYGQISHQGEPRIVVQDIKTGQSSEVSSCEFDQEIYERQMLRRKQENEYFVPVDKDLLNKLNRNLSMLPPAVIPAPMSTIRKMVLDIPTKTATETSYLMNQEGAITGGVARFPDGRHLFIAGDKPDQHTMIIISFIMFASMIPISDQIIFSNWAGLSEKEWSQNHRETFALTLYNYFLEIKEQDNNLPPEVMNAVDMLLEKGAVPSLVKKLSPEVKEVFKKMFVL